MHYLKLILKNRVLNNISNIFHRQKRTGLRNTPLLIRGWPVQAVEKRKSPEAISGLLTCECR
jgi:hypothetical protein